MPSSFSIIQNEACLYDSLNTLEYTHLVSMFNLLLSQPKQPNVVADGAYYLATYSGVISASVAAGVAFLINFLYWKHKNKVNKKAHFSILAMECLESFESLTVKYWSQDKVAENKFEFELIERQIKHQFRYLNSLIRHMKECDKKINSFDNSKVDEYLHDLYEVTTGHEFEQFNRKKNMNACTKIVTHSFSIKILLIKYSSIKA